MWQLLHFSGAVGQGDVTRTKQGFGSLNKRVDFQRGSSLGNQFGQNLRNGFNIGIAHGVLDASDLRGGNDT